MVEITLGQQCIGCYLHLNIVSYFRLLKMHLLGQINLTKYAHKQQHNSFAWPLWKLYGMHSATFVCHWVSKSVSAPAGKVSKWIQQRQTTQLPISWLPRSAGKRAACQRLYQDLRQGEILAGRPGAWLVKKKCFKCMQSQNLKKDLILKFKMISRTSFVFMIASMVYE